MTIEIDSKQFAEYKENKTKMVKSAYDWEAKFNYEFSLTSMGLHEKWNSSWQKAKQNDHVGIIHLDNNLSNNNFNNLEFVTESQYYILKELLDCPTWVTQCKEATKEWLVEQADYMAKQDAYYISYPIEDYGSLQNYYENLFSRIQKALNKELPDDSSVKKYWKQLNQRIGNNFSQMVPTKKRNKIKGFGK